LFLAAKLFMAARQIQSLRVSGVPATSARALAGKSSKQASLESFTRYPHPTSLCYRRRFNRNKIQPLAAALYGVAGFSNSAKNYRMR
jgi:hypothetical protein